MLKVNGFGCLMDHLGSIWNTLGISLFFPSSRRLMLLEKLCWFNEKNLLLTKFYMFHFVFWVSRISSVFHTTRIMLYFSANGILDFQWSLSRMKFSRTLFKGKGNFSISKKYCILQPLKWRQRSFLKQYTCLWEYLKTQGTNLLFK